MSKILDELGLTDEQKEALKPMIEGAVPYSRFQDVVKEKNDLKDQIKTLEKQIDDIKKDSSASEDLKTRIEAIQEENKKAKEAYEAEIKRLTRESINKELLHESGARDHKDFVGYLSDIDEDDAEKYRAAVSGRLEELKKSKDYLFKSEQETVPPSMKTPKPGDKGDDKQGSESSVAVNIVKELNARLVPKKAQKGDK